MRLPPRARLATWHVRALGALLLVQGLAGGVLKLVQGREGDLAHNALHVASGLAGLGLALGAGAGARARGFALAFGVGYVALGTVGIVAPERVPALALAAADNAFHLAVGGLTLAVGLLALREER